MSTRASAKKRKRQNKKKKTLLWLFLLALITALGILVFFLLQRISLSETVSPYSIENTFSTDTSEIEYQSLGGFAENLCVGSDGVLLPNVSLEDTQTGGLFNLKDKSIVYSKGIYDKVYPASITKLMTAILALKYGNLEDMVTISQSAVTLESGSQVAGFSAGDQVSMDALLQCLLVYSGNDAAAAIAEHIGGTQEQFVAMMNEEAKTLGMTQTSFTNPHGLHDDNHYTSVYDIYLMLNEAMSYSRFLEIIQQGSYTVHYTRADGTARETTLPSTDRYLTGEATAPKGVTVLGGKTGTTDQAGSCLSLISQNSYGDFYISIVLNASSKDQLYEQMNSLLSTINS
ncbi:MAG: D-alanyl-D-alanine carboxypeptidase family protein [Lachnospiraceae bacterium]